MPGTLLVVVRVPADEADIAADVLWMRGARAIEERHGAGVVELITELAVLDGKDALAWPAEVIEVGDAWRDAWRAWAQPVRAGRHLVVQPPWVAPLPAERDDVVLMIDPGRAFGSGAHPSTRLALAAMERIVVPHLLVLDVGCGSGVLSVAAARLGAGTVVAVDVDDEAVAATTDNAARNGVVVDVSSTALADIGGRFDLVVANLLAPTLIELAPLLGERLARPGSLVISGMLAGQSERVFEALGSRAVTVVDELDGWVAATLRFNG